MNRIEAVSGRTRPPGDVRILVADDFSEWRALVRDILRSRSEWQIIGEACDGLEAVKKAAELLPDVVLLDIRMPKLNGIEAAARILRDQPGIRIVFLTVNDDDEVRSAALATGAHGYVLKAESATQLQAGIDLVLQGGLEHQKPGSPALAKP